MIALDSDGDVVSYSRNLDTDALSSPTEDVFIIPRGAGEVRRLSQIVAGGNATWGGTQHGVQLLGDSILLYANDEGSPEGGINSGGSVHGYRVLPEQRAVALRER